MNRYKRKVASPDFRVTILNYRSVEVLSKKKKMCICIFKENNCFDTYSDGLYLDFVKRTKFKFEKKKKILVLDSDTEETQVVDGGTV